MSVQAIDFTRSTAAAPDAVWRLLADSATWPRWTPIEHYTPVQPAGADGTGEVRVFKTGRVTVREQIVESRPLERLSYVLLDGLAVRDYRANIDLTASQDGGTRIRWHTAFRAKAPGTGWLYRRALHRATERFIDGLADAATEMPAASPPS